MFNGSPMVDGEPPIDLEPGTSLNVRIHFRANVLRGTYRIVLHLIDTNKLWQPIAVSGLASFVVHETTRVAGCAEVEPAYELSVTAPGASPELVAAPQRCDAQPPRLAAPDLVEHRGQRACEVGAARRPRARRDCWRRRRAGRGRHALAIASSSSPGSSGGSDHAAADSAG